MLVTENICDRPGLRGIDAALKIALGVVAPVAESEMTALRASIGRVTAAEAVSAIDLPPFDQSAVDGYGIHVDDLVTGSTGPFRIAGKITAGSRDTRAFTPGEAVRLLTGAAIPKEVGAVHRNRTL